MIKGDGDEDMRNSFIYLTMNVSHRLVFLHLLQDELQTAKHFCIGLLISTSRP